MEELMISFLVKKGTTDMFKYLKSKAHIIKEFAYDLKNLIEIPRVLHEKRKFLKSNNRGFKKDIFYFGSSTFKKNFVELYDKYHKTLTSSFLNNTINLILT